MAQYAGVANDSLRTIADINSQQANEQYNKKMQAMQALQNAIVTNDPELRRLEEERSTRSGVMGALSNLKGLFTPTNDVIKTAASTQSISGGPQISGGSENRTDMAQRQDLLNSKLSDDQMKFILADKQYRAETGQRLTPQKYMEITGESPQSFEDPQGGVSSNINPEQMQLKDKLEKDLKSEREIAGTDAINKDNSKYLDHLKKNDAYHEEFKGNHQQMSGQNRKMFGEMYKAAIKNKDYDKIAEIRDEYTENQRGINQYWKTGDGKIDDSMFKDPRSGKGAGWKKIMYTPKFEGSLNFSETPVETEIPSNLHSDIDIFNYLNSKLPQGSRMAEWRRGKNKVENTAGSLDNATGSINAAVALGNPVLEGDEEIGRTVTMAGGQKAYLPKGSRIPLTLDKMVQKLMAENKSDAEIEQEVKRAGLVQ